MMSDYWCVCLYCGEEWRATWITREMKCKKCGDKNVKKREIEEARNVFGYDTEKPKKDAYFKDDED